MLTLRALSQTEAVLLHDELKTTPNILGYTIPELMRFQNVIVAEVDARFAGVCISKDLLFNWTDIAVLYILPEFRGRGLARELYTAAWENAILKRRHIFTWSCSPEVVHLMEDFGMTTSKSMFRMPLAVHFHMNVHMMSWYRISESIRKGRAMKRVMPLMVGTKKTN